MAMDDGATLPDLTLTGANGDLIALADFAGKPLVLYFYPKADTPGCTREAQDFGTLHDAFVNAGAAVLGVSRDGPAKLAKFRAKYGLAAPLASDADGSVTEAFGVWVTKSMYGKSYMGIERSTFLFDAGGTLVRTWRSVKVPGHAGDVLNAVAALG